MKVILTVFLAIASLKAFAQVETGTFVALRSSQNEIAVAADSRVLNTGRTSDDSCKIRALGNDLIFAASGISGLTKSEPGNTSWDSSTIAEKLFSRLSQERVAEPMPIRLANAWGDEVKNKLEAVLRERGMGFTAFNPTGNVLTAALFAGFDNGAPLIVVGTVSYTIDPLGVFNTKFVINRAYRGTASIMLGDPDIAAEIGTKSTPRAKQWMSNLPPSTDPVATLAIHEVDFAIKYSTRYPSIMSQAKQIAGPVDSVRLTPFKDIDWIQVKPNCPKD